MENKTMERCECGHKEDMHYKSYNEHFLRCHDCSVGKDWCKCKRFLKEKK